MERDGFFWRDGGVCRDLVMRLGMRGMDPIIPSTSSSSSLVVVVVVGGGGTRDVDVGLIVEADSDDVGGEDGGEVPAVALF